MRVFETWLNPNVRVTLNSHDKLGYYSFTLVTELYTDIVSPEPRCKTEHGARGIFSWISHLCLYFSPVISLCNSRTLVYTERPEQKSKVSNNRGILYMAMKWNV